MKIRVYGIILCSLLIMIMTACNLSPDESSADIALTSVSELEAGNQPEATAEVTPEVTDEAEIEVTDEVEDTADNDVQVTQEARPQQPASNSNTTTSNNNQNTGTINTTVITTTTCTKRTDWTTYTVNAGDTLAKIAGRVSSSVSELTQANCLNNANLLTVGQQLYVPRKPSTTSGNDVVIIPAKTNCLITINTRTAVIDMPTGVPSKTIGYLEAGTVIAPLFKLKGTIYYGIPYQGLNGLVSVAPTGDCSQLPEHVAIDVPAPDVCRIFVNARTEVVNLPQGTSATILGYLPAGSTVEPTVQISALKTYGFNFQGQTGWINIQPTGDCSQLQDLYDNPPNDNRCLITVTARTEVVNAPQGTGRTILGYLPVGSTVEPTIHFEGLSYYGFNFQGQTGWINAQPTGDCSNLSTTVPDDPTSNKCTAQSSQPVNAYDLPDTSSTVVDIMQSGVIYDVIGKIHETWYKVKFPNSGMAGWAQVSVSGNCANLPAQVFDCQFVGDARVPIYSEPKIGGQQLGTLEAGDVYRFASFEGEWTSGDVSGYWIKIFYTTQRPIGGYIQNTGGHLEGNCPTR